MATKFLRRTWYKFSKLGKRRKKKQVWRKPTGRDNKMREKRKGYASVVSIGYGKGEKNIEKNKIVYTLKELEQLKEKSVILGKVGKRKKIEIVKKAKEKGIKILNVNEKKYLKKNQKKKVEEKSTSKEKTQ
jgi:large subunit ribosomal protein L32e